MDEQKIIKLASRLLTAGITQNEEELKEIYSELAEELRQKADVAVCVDARSGEDFSIGFLKFTNQEISKMKKSFSKSFIQNGRIVHYRRRVRGKNSLSYEIRYRRDGYNISVSAPDLQTAKERFIEAVNRPTSDCGAALDVPTSFCDFAEYFFEKFYVRKVKPSTYRTETQRFNRHIKPYFGNVQIKRITPEACQNLIDGLVAEKKTKTASEVQNILSNVFKCAIRHQLIRFNPLDIVVKCRHEQETGVAFTKAEERELLSRTAGTPYQLMFAVALYTGLRPNEYSSARIEGNFIIAVNSKRKNGKVEYKKIGISPMLRPFLVDVETLHFYVLNRIREKLHTISPNHALKDLRKTFNSRCQECGVLDVVRKLFMGHSLGKLDNTYTTISDDVLLRESEKLNYNYEVAPELPPNNEKNDGRGV